MFRIIALALFCVCFLWFATGCERSTTTPDEPKPEIRLGVPWSYAEWYLTDNPCPDEGYCLNHLFAFSRLSGPTTITVTVKGTLGSIEQTAEMTSSDYNAFFELVEDAVWDAIRSRNNAYVGCDTSIGYSEIIGFFAGDAGFCAQIEGCDDQNAVEIREQVLELVARYFPSEVAK